MIFFIILVYFIFGIGYSLVKLYKLDGLIGGLLVIVIFFLIIVFIVIEGFIFDLLKIVEKSLEFLVWYNLIF